MDSLLTNQRWTWRAPLRLGLTLMGSLLMTWVRVLLSLISFFYMFPRVVLLTLCLAIVHMKFLGLGTSYCKSCFGSDCPYYFWDHPAFKGYWFEGPLLGRKGMLLVVRWGCAIGFDGPSTVHACPTLHYWCQVLAVEGWHSLCRATRSLGRLWWVWQDSSHAFPHYGGIYSLPLLSFLFLHFSTWWCLNVMFTSSWTCCWWSCWPSSSTLGGLCLWPRRLCLGVPYGV